MNDPALPTQPPQIEPTLRAIAMPADTNPHGDIFGGWLLSQMDLAGTTVATRRSKGRTVTVAITGMSFHRPVFVGDEVSLQPIPSRHLTNIHVPMFVRALSGRQLLFRDGPVTRVS
jgi:acyl-CoA hydrolase